MNILSGCNQILSIVEGFLKLNQRAKPYLIENPMKNEVEPLSVHSHILQFTYEQ